MIKIKILLILLILFIIPSVQAIRINSISSNQDNYKNGDLVILTIVTDKDNLIINGDFSKVDSKYNQGSVLTESNGYVYKVIYAITFQNTRGNGIYNAVINLYDPVERVSSAITYGIDLTNTIDEMSYQETIKLSVRGTIEYTVEEGKIRICDVKGCITMTEAEYEQSRKLIIAGGDVTLANVTYNNLKNEISDSVREEVRKDINNHLSKILDAYRLLQLDIKNIEIMIDNVSTIFHNQSQRSERLLNQTKWIGLGTILLVLLILASAFYIFYLKTNTTWLEN